ncbi:Rv3235 family protein [Streptomyces sp. NPDC049915]|uniref:Rv3235 family protein n=1 Tax=Streptomyces sp. NPDC049915 TaxID=3155510 RepID=UPI0034287701
MNKVMTRLQRRSGTRPTGRRDTTRPGGSPPRTPGGTPPRTTSGARPPAGPGRTPRARTRPTDTRPPTTTPALVPTDFFAERLLAVLTGRRPVHFMLGHTRGRAYDELAWLAERGPLRTARGPQPVVHDLGYYEVHPGALEVFARITTGTRLSALAFRLERGQDQRWRCTAVDTGGPRRPDTD